MKKHFILFSILVVFFSCSSSDDSGKQVTNLTPPNWILGDWRYLVSVTGGEALTSDGYNFIVNDVCEVYTNNTICFKSTYSAEPGFYFTEYIKNDNEYKFSYTIGNVTKEFFYRRLDQNKIRQLSGVDYENAVLQKL